MRWLVPAALVAVAVVAPSAGAQPSSAATVEDMVQALTPPARTRSLGATTRNLTPMLDLTVNFEFDSASLREDGKELLRGLAVALTDARLSALRFRIEGHTDARGTAGHNDQLSQRRADSVAAFLAAQGVARDRLDTMGKGFRELLDPQQPNSPANRRVRVLTLP